MSRIGKKVIDIPNGVTVDVQGLTVQVKGPLGIEKCILSEGIVLQIEGQHLQVNKQNADDELLDAKHGLYRALLANSVKGVSQGFERDLEIVGVGYRATQQGKDIVFQLGFSHNIMFAAPEGIVLQVVEPTKVKVKGINKEQVGQVASNIRELRPPEPYKGKGIRYKEETVRRKAGKTGKK